VTTVCPWVTPQILDLVKLIAFEMFWDMPLSVSQTARLSNNYTTVAMIYRR